MLENEAKHIRLLEFCVRLLDGEAIDKQEEALKRGKSARSIQRDFKDLQNFFQEYFQEEGDKAPEIAYVREAGGHVLIHNDQRVLTAEETLGVCKVLLASRAFTKTEMNTILDKIIRYNIGHKRRREVEGLLKNERHHYRPTLESQDTMERLWKLGEAVGKQQVVTVTYERLDGNVVHRDLQPLGILFAEFYFYLIAYIEDVPGEVKVCDAPIVYRLDRIRDFSVLPRTYRVIHTNRFKENEFRDRVQFMHGGPLEHIRFRYMGHALDVVLDRFPSASYTEETQVNGRPSYIVSTDVYGKGYEMWLRAQGSQVQLLDPPEAVAHFKEEIKKMEALYEEDNHEIVMEEAE